jgi:hypothetical protein
MQPQLKIGPLVNLQDARYSAAVGFDIVSFSLERGSDRKLSVSMIWNMVQWLTGPEAALEMNVASLEELNELDKSFAYAYITLPAEEWDERVLLHTAAGIIVRADASADPDHLATLLQAGAAAGRPMWLELLLESAEAFAPYQNLSAQCFLHFATLDTLSAFLDLGQKLPYGISLGLEAEEEPGTLDYERIDAIVQRIQGE